MRDHDAVRSTDDWETWFDDEPTVHDPGKAERGLVRTLATTPVIWAALLVETIVLVIVLVAYIAYVLG